MYLLYSLAMLLVFLAASPYFLYQAVRHGKYTGSLPERLGFLPVSLNLDREPSIWIHAVSVGEALTARAIAGDLKARYPHLRLFVSTTTMTGQQVRPDFRLHHDEQLRPNDVENAADDEAEVNREEEDAVGHLEALLRHLLSRHRGGRDEQTEVGIAGLEVARYGAGGERFPDRHGVNPDGRLAIEVQRDREKPEPFRQVAGILPMADGLVQEVRRRRQEHQQHREAVEQVHRPHQDTTRV